VIDHFKEAEAVLVKAQQSLNAMHDEGDWTPAEIAAAMQTRYLEAIAHGVLALVDEWRNDPKRRAFVPHKQQQRRSA
jgi:hypothetical protein